MQCSQPPREIFLLIFYSTEFQFKKPIVTINVYQPPRTNLYCQKLCSDTELYFRQYHNDGNISKLFATKMLMAIQYLAYCRKRAGREFLARHPTTDYARTIQNSSQILSTTIPVRQSFTAIASNCLVAVLLARRCYRNTGRFLNGKVQYVGSSMVKFNVFLMYPYSIVFQVILQSPNIKPKLWSLDKT